MVDIPPSFVIKQLADGAMVAGHAIVAGLALGYSCTGDWQVMPNSRGFTPTGSRQYRKRQQSTAQRNAAKQSKIQQDNGSKQLGQYTTVDRKAVDKHLQGVAGGHIPYRPYQSRPLPPACGPLLHHGSGGTHTAGCSKTLSAGTCTSDKQLIERTASNIARKKDALTCMML